VAAVEFAAALPLIFLFVFTLTDAVQFGRGHLRVQSAAMQIGQIISQCERFNTDDETVLMDLTERLLGRFAENSARYALRITAFGRDGSGTDGNYFEWSVSKNAGAGRTGEPALNVVSKGSQLPEGSQGTYKLARNRALFRTEVFASLDRTPLTRAVSLLRDKGVAQGFTTARGEAVFSTRASHTNALRTKGSSSEKGCLT
jgi:Flp pilus assembly protein TadG